MKQFKVTGMSCAACSARVEHSVSSLPGVTECAVSLLTNSMGVIGTATDEEIIEAVENAGYHAVLIPGNAKTSALFTDERTPVLKKRLVSSVIVLLVLLYVSMGYCMWGWPFPEFLKVRPISVGCIELLLSAVIIFINQQFFVSAIRSISHKAPNMDVLVSLGSGASFLYSTAVLLIMMAEQESGHYDLVEMHLHDLYFESAAMILTLITVGKLLESVSKGKTTNAIRELIHLQPQTATVIIDDKEETVPVSQVKVGDIFIVKPGESIPFDGTVTEGTSSVNESAITGESLPRDISVGDSVKSASINLSGYFKCRAEKVGEDTTLSQIIKLVSDASATKAPIAKTADKVSRIFVPAVLAIAFITLIVWILIGKNIGFCVARAVSVLVISCPCALGLATPVAIMVGSGKGAKNGILFKNALAMELTGKMRILALDKTGTVTSGEPKVTDHIAYIDEKRFLNIAYNLEKRSEHPFGEAVVRFIESEYDDASVREEILLEDFEALFGRGLKAVIASDSSKLICGNIKCMYENNIAGIDDEVKNQFELFASCGKTPVFFAVNGELIGLFAIADVIKENCSDAIRQLGELGVGTIMLTGDNKKVAEYIGGIAGVDKVVSEIIPQEKEKIIRLIKECGQGKKEMIVSMAGDGINDAPALTRADVGIAVGSGTDIAIESADVILMKNDIKDIPAAIRLSRRVLLNIKENLFWAFIYNIICIPLAAGVFTPLFGWSLSPMIAAAAMSLSSFCVVMNSLRLNLFDMYNSKNDRKDTSVCAVDVITDELIEEAKKQDEETEFKDEESILDVSAANRNNEKELISEGSEMEKTLKIEGMMCPHCENRVKKALEAVDGVTEAAASHTEGTAVVKMSKDIPFDVLKEAVEAADYKVVD